MIDYTLAAQLASAVAPVVGLLFGAVLVVWLVLGGFHE